MKNFIEKIRNWYRNLPDKKKYVEFITAILSVPVMVTVIILNLNNLNQSKKSSTSTTGQTTPVQIIITGGVNQDKGKDKPPPIAPILTQTVTPTASPSPTLTPTGCKKQIGPVEILSPQEGEIITEEMVCTNISTSSDYCPVIWAYKIDDGNWSNYANKEICLYNLANGEKELQIKIKSTVSDEEITLKRNFTYSGSTLTPTSTPIPTPTTGL